MKMELQLSNPFTKQERVISVNNRILKSILGIVMIVMGIILAVISIILVILGIIGFGILALALFPINVILSISGRQRITNPLRPKITWS